MVHTPKQMLMNESGIMPRFAPGGKVLKGALSLLQKEANKAKYLKDTKVVDHNGKPITMYHHTTDFKGDAFDPAFSQQKDRGYHAQGMYFGSDDYLKRSAFGKHSTGNVAGQEGFEEGSQVIPVNLNIKNPKYIDVADQSLYGIPAEELKKQGYDGVIVTRDDSFTNAMGRVIPRQKVYNAVAFEPTQVKSAIGNEGTYDVADPRLHKAEGGHISAEDMLAELIYNNRTPEHFASGGQPTPKKSFAKKLIMPGILAGMLAPDIANAATEAKEGKYGEAAATAGLVASGFLPGPLQAILMGLYPSELGKGTLDEYYNERVPGSVLPARLKPEDMR
jgi:hypothetical protein